MDLRASLDCTPRKGPPTPSQPSRRPIAPVDSKLLHLPPSAGAAPDAAALALALHADTDALAVQLEGRMAGVLAGYRELNDLASAAPKVQEQLSFHFVTVDAFFFHFFPALRPLNHLNNIYYPQTGT